MIDDERVWWMILVRADALSAKGDPNCLRAMNVYNKAVTTLRDRYGINLDIVADKANQLFFDLWKEEQIKEEEEAKRRQEYKELILKSKKLIDQKASKLSVNSYNSLGDFGGEPEDDFEK